MRDITISDNEFEGKEHCTFIHFKIYGIPALQNLRIEGNKFKKFSFNDELPYGFLAHEASVIDNEMLDDSIFFKAVSTLE